MDIISLPLSFAPVAVSRCMMVNSALVHWSEFRTCHVIIVTRYNIVLQKGSGLLNRNLETKGTGGTDFLKRVRNDIKKLLSREP